MHQSLAFTTLALVSAASTLNVPRQSSNSSGYSVKTPPLTTPWTYTAGTDPWPEYPRPQLSRSQWQSLNGIWTYQNASSLDSVNSPPFSQTLGNSVLIPSCIESGLSGMLNIVCHGHSTLTHLKASKEPMRCTHGSPQLSMYRRPSPTIAFCSTSEPLTTKPQSSSMARMQPFIGVATSPSPLISPTICMSMTLMSCK